jgi:hypothetical protein
MIELFLHIVMLIIYTRLAAICYRRNVETFIKKKLDKKCIEIIKHNSDITQLIPVILYAKDLLVAVAVKIKNTDTELIEHAIIYERITAKMRLNMIVNYHFPEKHAIRNKTFFEYCNEYGIIRDLTNILQERIVVNHLSTKQYINYLEKYLEKCIIELIRSYRIFQSGISC